MRRDAYDPHYLRRQPQEAQKKRGFAGCLAVLVALVADRSAVPTRRAHQGLRLHPGPASPAPRTTRARARARSPSRSRGRHRRRRSAASSRPRAWWPRSTRSSTPPNGKQRDPGRLLPAQEGDARRRRVRVLINPANHRQQAVTIPEGLRVADIVRSWPRRPKFSAKQFEKALPGPRQRSAFRRTPRATRGLPLPRRPTTSGRRRSRSTCSRTWSTAGSRPPRSTTWRRRPRSWATRPAEMMTIASLIQAEGRGERHAQGRPGDLQPARGPATRAAPTACSRSTRRSTTRWAASGVVAVTQDETSDTDSPYNTYRVRRACRPARSSRRAMRRSRRRPTRPTGPGSTTSR